MKKSIYCKLILIICVLLIFLNSAIAQTFIRSGNVSGTWSKDNSPYNILGEISIPFGQTLMIEPGVEIIFITYCKLNVQGRVIAVGTKTDSIKFTASNKQSGWHGIRFDQTSDLSDTSKFDFCSFAYGNANTGYYDSYDRCGGAIFIRRFNKVLISNSLFEFNRNDGNIESATGGAAIYIGWAKSVIKNCTFRNNVGTTDCSILCWYSNALITNNVFINNSGPHGAIFCGYKAPTVSGNIISQNVTTRAGGGIFNMTTNALVINNIIIHNSCFGGEGEGGGIKCWDSDKSMIINNTIAYNSAAHGGGICCNTSSSPIFINNIVWGNNSTDGAQVNLLDNLSDPHFLYCDIEGRKEAFGGSGGGANYSGIYEGNIDLDPLFKDSSMVDFSLSDGSHCIGAGVDSIEVLGKWYYTPPYCILGNPRPNPVGTRPDIGACESPLGSILGIKQEIINPKDFLLSQNFPNPFNNSTVIRYSIPKEGLVTLKVYNMLGEKVTTLVNEQKEAGNYQATFNSDQLTSGVYLYKLTSGGFTQTKKMILLK
jgi:hypothetical protein